MGFTITPAKAAKADTLANVTVSDEVAENMAEVWKLSQDDASLVWTVEFDSTDERDTIEKEMRKWAQTQTDPAVRFRVTKGSKSETGFTFAVSRILTDEEKAQAEADKAERRAAREAAGKATPGRKAKDAS